MTTGDASDGDLVRVDQEELLTPSFERTLDLLLATFSKAEAKPEFRQGLQFFAIEGVRGVLVRIKEHVVEVHLPSVRWEGHRPVPASRFWRSIPTEDLSSDALHEFVRRGIHARRSQFRRCRFCGRLVPPEHRYRPDVCYGCATNHLGKIF